MIRNIKVEVNIERHCTRVSARKGLFLAGACMVLNAGKLVTIIQPLRKHNCKHSSECSCKVQSGSRRHSDETYR